MIVPPKCRHRPYSFPQKLTQQCSHTLKCSIRPQENRNLGDPGFGNEFLRYNTKNMTCDEESR